MPVYYFRVEIDGTLIGVGDVGGAGRRAGEWLGLWLHDIGEARSHAQKIDDAIRFSGHQRQWAIVVTNEQGTVVYEICRETTASVRAIPRRAEQLDADDNKVLDLIDREELWKHRRPKARSWVRRRDRVDEEREGEPRSDTKDKN